MIGGCFDAEFVTWSDALMRDFRAERFMPVLSDVTAAEIAAAPAAVRVLHQELLTLSGGIRQRGAWRALRLMPGVRPLSERPVGVDRID